MKVLCLHPLFFVGAAIRLGLMFAVSPTASTDWYVPFLEASANQLSIDPWGAWLAGGGDPLAFPYGYAMWLAFLPSILVSEELALPAQYGYWLTLAAVDVGLLSGLRRLLPDIPPRQLLLHYWLSPIVLLATYGLGLNDLVPVLLMTLAFVLVRRPATTTQSFCAGAVCSLAVSAKLSMVICVPFFLIYLHNGKVLRQYLAAFLVGLSLCALFFIASFLLSGGGQQMLFENPEMRNIYHLNVQLNNGALFYIVPALYCVTLYYMRAMDRVNFDLFLAVTGLSFLLVTLFAATSPGWFIWNMPFLLFYLSTGRSSTTLILVAFSASYTLATLFFTPLHLANGAVLNISGLAPRLLHSLCYTFLIVVGVVLAFHAWRDLVKRNDFFRLSRKPLVFGIAGDSGSGKTSLACSLTKLLGAHSVVEISGDNYHLWDRHEKVWKALTHLNPMANDLERFGNDLAAVADRTGILSPRYDHSIGKMSTAVPIRSNDFVIASGLHTLYSPVYRRLYDLKIYLDMDEALRRYFKQKRDAVHRGYSAAEVADLLQEREDDACRFILPQRAFADLVFSVQPASPQELARLADESRLHLKLKVHGTRLMNEASLIRALISICGAHVDAKPYENHEKMRMVIEGEISADDIALVAEIACPRVLGMLDLRPQWQDGVSGLMQVITLCHLDHALMRRLV